MFLLAFLISFAAFSKNVEPQLRDANFQVLYDRSSRELNILSSDGAPILKNAFLSDTESKITSRDDRYNSYEEVKKADKQLIISFADRKMEIDLKLIITLTSGSVEVESFARSADGETPLELKSLELVGSSKAAGSRPQVIGEAQQQKARIVGPKLRFLPCSQHLTL